MAHLSYKPLQQVGIARFLFLQGIKENNLRRISVNIGRDTSNTKRRAGQLRSLAGRPSFLRLICRCRVTCFSSRNAEIIVFREFDKYLKGATRTLPIYVTLTWAPGSSASFYRSINDRKPDFWRGTNSISI